MTAANHSVGVRVQSLSLQDQAIALARLAEARGETATFTPKDLGDVFEEVSLPQPVRVGNVLAALRKKGLVTPGKGRGEWKITPLGRAYSTEVLADIDMAALEAEAAAPAGTILAGTRHTVVPPSLAPPGLVPGLRRFLGEHPFETNVFGMTRFPDDRESDDDPVVR